MSFAGSVQAMITSLKNNARPKRRTFDKIKEGIRLKWRAKKGLQFKKVSEEELEKIKTQIRTSAFRYKKRNAIISAFILLLGLIAFTLLRIWFL